MASCGTLIFEKDYINGIFFGNWSTQSAPKEEECYTIGFYEGIVWYSFGNVRCSTTQDAGSSLARRFWKKDWATGGNAKC